MVQDSKKDSLGVMQLPHHDPDPDLPFGGLVYAVVRDQGTLIDVCATRHDAMAVKSELGKSVDEFEIVPTRVGNIRLRDAKRPFRRGDSR